MKSVSVAMVSDFHVHLSEAANCTYRAGQTYHGVLNNHARQIVAAGAGSVVEPDKQSEARDGGAEAKRRRPASASRSV